jgi:anti-sigma factor RsiW
MGMGDAGDLTCQELVELVTDYFENALTPAERARFEAHLEGCPGCKTYVEQMRLTLRLVQASDELEQRPEVGRLMQAFREWKH